MSFGGFSKKYLFRQLFFGSLFLALTVFDAINGGSNSSVGSVVLSLISTLLYPYSRFVYESIVGFMLGENLFDVNALLMLVVTFITIFIFWSLVIFVASGGLIYLCFYHYRAAGEV
ncbi:hypothetical protein [Pseudomonas citronellolis]|uniref:hypothetical protein n=1 Tax=Pseudomonas citronellolis TaxID=53408 RepID=UPI00209DC416|nr:hypothetical protein [Pseudomonas citronellolis]